ncbi:type 1 glutamine amidotransferase [Agilicoccus flavus]|uniref:type 1 glutamine amidotransferase n=1 Tax=Agilicoccus flavus TaxID=2775968 RepID=UPI001CF64162|nr:cobalamin biosynthesis protein CobB [Agilicoccus flavus]
MRLQDPQKPKARITLVHLYPREMSIYGDLGNTHVLATRLRRHGYGVDLVDHHPGQKLPAGAHLVVGGGGQDSGQARVEADLEDNGPLLAALARDGVPMLMICGMYQLFGHDFTTVDGRRLPGLGILDVTTRGNTKRMVGPVALQTPFGDVVGYENHSGSTVLGPDQEPFGQVVAGFGNNGDDGTEGAVKGHVYGTYLHGPALPANPAFADALIKAAVDRVVSRGFEPEELDDTFADQARKRQVARLTAVRRRGLRERLLRR